jgi:hypothetical protein
MSGQIWSWVLAIFGVTGMWYVGKKNAHAFFFLTVNELLWVAFAIHTEQYGFIFMAFCYASIYLRNGLKWLQEK